MLKIGIVGLGVVGQSMKKLFSPKFEILGYDKFLELQSNTKDAINGCDLVFISVSTPTGDDGYSCDISAVEECVSWITAPACIRSTVTPGTTLRLSARYPRLAFCPEHLRETTWDKFENDFVIVGGAPSVCRLVIRAFQMVLGANTKYMTTDPTTAELSKYMLNCYLATKVAFCNQFQDIARNYGVDYNELRELWLLDKRIGRSHTMVTEERGFGGKCLPKDLRAIISENPEANILKAANDYNDSIKK
jgi:UDPglucose 6-dehydrogenase